MTLSGLNTTRWLRIAAALSGVMMLQASLALAAVNRWTDLGPDGTAHVVSLGIDPSSTSTVFAGTWGAGLYKSTDGGATWTAVNAGLTDLFIPAVTVDPATSSVVYAGSDGGDLLRSSDGGTSWSLLKSFPNSSVLDIAVDPQTSSTLYVAAYGTGVWKSSDGGATWSNLGTFTSVYVVKIDPTNPAVLYNGYQKSTDGGMTWSQLGFNDYNRVSAFAINPGDTLILYAGTKEFTPSLDGQAYRSLDGGTTWTVLSNGLPRRNIHDIAVSPSSPTVVYMAVRDEGVFKSVDSGDTWAAVNTGLPNLVEFPVRVLAADPSDASVVYAGSEPAAFYSGPGGGRGVFKTTDAGANWSSSNKGLFNLDVQAVTVDPAHPQVLYVASDGDGVFKSSDGGASWSPENVGLTSLSVNGLAVDPTTTTVLYAIAQEWGVFKTVDGGTGWVDVSPPGTCVASSIVVDPNSPATVYLGCDGDGVYKTTDGGTNWSQMITGLTQQDVQTLAIDPSNPNTLYAGTGSGALKSVDGAQTWTDASFGLHGVVNAIVVDPQSPDVLYAGTQVGIYKSLDAGVSWSPLDGGLGLVWTEALALDPTWPSKLYAGTYEDGVFRSTDGGASWVPMNSGLDDYHVLSLAVDPVTPSVLYMGTSARGCWVRESVLQIVTSPPFPDALVGSAYSQALTAIEGVEPYTWSIVSGALPPGLSLDSATGLIDGTPTQGGVFDFRVQVDDAAGGTATKDFSLGVTYFQDVSSTFWAFDWITTLVESGVTSGCSVDPPLYCPYSETTRGQMAVFLLASKEGTGYAPPPAVGMFDDVPVSSPFAPWIEELANRGITAGCNTDPPLYCPGDPVTRGQMAVFLLATLEGTGYAPPPAVGVFDDVPVSSPFAPWIEELANRGITAGCNTDPPLYCPGDPVTRGQMAVFLVSTFGLGQSTPQALAEAPPMRNGPGTGDPR